MTKREIYESKFISIPEALEKIRSGDTIAVGHYGNEPAAAAAYHSGQGGGCDRMDQQSFGGISLYHG